MLLLQMLLYLLGMLLIWIGTYRAFGADVALIYFGLTMLILGRIAAGVEEGLKQAAAMKRVRSKLEAECAQEMELLEGKKTEAKSSEAPPNPRWN